MVKSTDQNTGRTGERALVYLAAGISALSGLLFGYDTAVINGALVFLRQEFNLSIVQTEFAATCLLMGCLAGASLAGTLSDHFGRRTMLFASASIFCITSLATACVHGFVSLSVARVIAGIAVGMASVLAPMYIAEISPPKSRGQLITLNQLAVATGIVTAYIMNWCLSVYHGGSWRLMFAAAAVPAVMLFVGLLFVPESPRWLIRKGRLPEALLVLRRFLPEAEAQSANLTIEAELEHEPVSLGELIGSKMRAPLLVGLILAALSQITGINAVIYYGSLILERYSASPVHSNAIGANLLIGIASLLCTVVAVALIDRVGRRPLLLLSSAAMSICLGVLGAVSRVEHPDIRIVIALLVGYVGSFSVGMGSVTWVYIAELFPLRTRGLSMSLATSVLWIGCICVTMSFLTLQRYLQSSGVFWLYAIICIGTCIFTMKCLPETKGIKLEEIQSKWAHS